MKCVVQEVQQEGLESFLGKPVTLWGVNYIYTGILVGVNEVCVKLENAEIIYETGSFKDSGWKDAQSLPGNAHYVMLAAIESFGGVK